MKKILIFLAILALLMVGCKSNNGVTGNAVTDTNTAGTDTYAPGESADSYTCEGKKRALQDELDADNAQLEKDNVASSDIVKHLRTASDDAERAKLADQLRDVRTSQRTLKATVDGITKAIAALGC